jgi:hypothetical protein
MVMVEVAADETNRTTGDVAVARPGVARYDA